MPHRSHSPRSPSRRLVDALRAKDVDPVRKSERERQLVACMAVVKLEKTEGTKDETKEKEFDAMAEFCPVDVLTLWLCVHAPFHSCAP